MARKNWKLVLAAEVILVGWPFGVAAAQEKSVVREVATPSPCISCGRPSFLLWNRCKGRLEKWFAPDAPDTSPLGQSVYQTMTNQVASGVAARMILNDFDFEPNSVILNFRGREKLPQLAALAMRYPYYITVERTNYDPALADLRRHAVVKEMARLSIPVSAERIVVGGPLTPGLSGVERSCFTSLFSIRQCPAALMGTGFGRLAPRRTGLPESAKQSHVGGSVFSFWVTNPGGIMQKNRRGWLAVLAGCVLLSGCQGPGSHPTRTSPASEKTPDLTAAQKADVQFALARSVEKSGDLGQASAMYQDVLKKDPRRADALDRLAVIHARQEQFEQAVALHKKALAIQPVNADFRCNLGYCYYLQNRWAEAEIQLQKAIELAPNHQRAHNNLGLVLARTERSQKALAEFRRAGCTEADAHSNLAFVLTLANSGGSQGALRSCRRTGAVVRQPRMGCVSSVHLKDIEDGGSIVRLDRRQDIRSSQTVRASNRQADGNNPSYRTVWTAMTKPPLSRRSRSRAPDAESDQPGETAWAGAVNAEPNVANAGPSPAWRRCR